jgi:hypothetical protein
MRSLVSSFVLSVVVVVGAAASSSRAAEPAPNAGLRQLIGKWTGSGTIKSQGKVHAAKATVECVDAAAGVGARCKWTITGIPGFTYVVEDVWGHSAGDGLVHWYAVTNGGEVHDHKGHFTSDGGVLEFDGPMGGKTFSEVVRVKFVDGKKLVLDANCTLGGEPYEAVQLELSK